MYCTALFADCQAKNAILRIEMDRKCARFERHDEDFAAAQNWLEPLAALGHL
jgi:hypothetical protein